MQAGLKVILSEIAKSEGDKLDERYRNLILRYQSLTAGYEGTIEGVQHELELARAVSSPEPNRGLEIANGLFQQLAGHSFIEWQELGLDCLQIMISIFKRLGKIENVDLLKKEVASLNEIILEKKKAHEEGNTAEKPVSSYSMKLGLTADISGVSAIEQPADTKTVGEFSKGKWPLELNSLGAGSNHDFNSQISSNSHHGLPVREEFPDTSYQGGEAAWLAVRELLFGSIDTMSLDYPEKEVLLTEVVKQIPQKVPYRFLKEIIDDMPIPEVWLEKRHYWLVIFFEGLGVEGTLGIFNRAGVGSREKDLFAMTITEMLKNGWARRCLFLCYSLLSVRCDNAWAIVLWKFLPSIWQSLNLEPGKWVEADGPEALLSLLGVRRLPL